MQVQHGREQPCVFVSHTLSEQASRWGIMELELYAFVHCVKQLAPYLLGRRFTVRKDHKNLVFLSDSTIPMLALACPTLRVPVSSRAYPRKMQFGG